MEKTIEQLEKELAKMIEHHRSASEIYGSELCAGDMIRQEEELEKQIRKLKAEKLKILKGYEENVEKPVNGIEQLREVREETRKRWEESGVLDGLTGNPDVNMAAMFQADACQRIPENETFTRAEVIVIIKRYAFHLSDNGDPDENVKEWFDRLYPEK
jgi:flavodoxin